MRGVVVFSAATGSHTLLDYVMTESRGVALWWPFSDRRYKFRGPNPIDYTFSGTSFSDVTFEVLRICFTKLIIFAPLLLLVILLRRLQRRGEDKWPHYKLRSDKSAT